MASFADYQIVLIDINTGLQLDIVTQSRFNGLTYAKVLNDTAQVQFTVPMTDQSSAYRDLDTLIEVYRRPEPNLPLRREQTYLMRYVSIYYDEATETEYITRGGVSVDDLLKCRIIFPADDPFAAGGYISYQNNAAIVMNFFVQYQMVTPLINADRAFPNMVIDPNLDLGNIIFQRRAWENLYDVIYDCSVKGDIDFEIYREMTGTFAPPIFHFFSHKIGLDKTVTTNIGTSDFILFSPERTNMRSPVLTLNRYEERNQVYVLGQGTQAAREVFPQSGDTIADSPFNRREGTTDARDISYGVLDGFITAGSAYLQDNEPNITFDFEPDLDAPQGQYGLDWDIGYFVSVLYHDYAADYRIQKIEVTIAEGDENIQLSLLKKSQFES